jgi:hypothetical protein
VIEKIQIHIHNQFFLGLKFCTNVKNEYEKEIFGHFFFWVKKVIRFAKKLRIMLKHFPIGFDLVTIFKMFK